LTKYLKNVPESQHAHSHHVVGGERATPAAFDLGEGTVRTFQIALVGEPRDKYGVGDS